ncbi:MAG TPA: hypothetical protein VKE22_04145 [Haliangiales bacterium]|nr:hypothetical protein [Haliangiales bacterium]
MRFACGPALALAAALAGCDAYTGRIAFGPFHLVVDDARLAASRPDGSPWCASGQLGVSVTVTWGGVPFDTPVVAGLEPRWSFSVLDASGPNLALGFDVALNGHCDGSPFPIAMLPVHLARVGIWPGEIVIVSFGAQARLRLHLDPLDSPRPFDPGLDPLGEPGIDTGDPCDCVWIDTSVDDGVDPGAGDPGGIDTGDPGVDPGDPGA